MGRAYHGCGEEYNFEKRTRGRHIILFILLRLLKLEEYQVGKGEVDGHSGEEDQNLKKKGGGI